MTQDAATKAVTAQVEEPMGEPQTIGRFKILEKIGEGGCGVVFVAEQTEPVRRRVALKVIKLGMDTKAVVARFEAERQALAMMDHPNIAKVLDAGTTELGRPYFVMELVRGVPITQYCDQANLGTKERLDLFIKVCQAIQHAHQKGIIHRDIKPSNILVTLQDGVPAPKVIDFGIARAIEGRLTEATIYTQLNQFIGTPAYMSPEQAEMSGLDVDTRSDIYSLGVLLYELLTGKTPFDGEELLRSGLDEMRKTIREKEAVRPSTRLATLEGEELTATAKRRSSHAPKLIHQIKGDLDWIVMKCLEKDRTRRYDTSNVLAGDITRHLRNEPVVARPPSVGYQLQKAFRRNKLLFGAVGMVATALVLGIAVSTWQAFAAIRARTAEEEQRLAAQTAQKEAERAGAAEKEERLKADAEKIAAQRYLYVANMNLAQQAWEQNDIDRLRQLLNDTQNSSDRGFEWFYWQRQLHLPIKTLRGHLKEVYAASFSPDGKRILTGSFDTTAKVWDAASGRELLTLKGHSTEIRSAAFSPDGQRIVTGSHDYTAKVWDAASGQELLTLKGHTAQILWVAFSPDSKRIVTGSHDLTARVWDAANGSALLSLKGHSALIWSVAFSPDGQRIVTGSLDSTARIWDAATGRELAAFNGHTGPILSAAFSPDGWRILTGSLGVATMWEVASGRELFTLKGHGSTVRGVAFSPDGKRIITGSLDHTAKVWDAGTGQELFTLKGHSGIVPSVAFSPDSQWILTGSIDRTVKLWEAARSRELLELTGHTNSVYSVAFSQDGQRIVTGSWDETAKMWETASGQELITLNGHKLGILSVAFSPDNERIATGSWDETAKVWEAASGRELLTFKGHRGSIWSAAFSPDGRRIVTGSYDRTAKVWESGSGRELITLEGHRDRIWSVAFSPEGQRILTGSGDRTAKIWDAASGQELITLKGHSALVKSVAFSRDGRRIVTGSADKTAKLWDAASGQELFTLKGHGHQVRAVAFAPDGQRVLTGSADETIKVWDTAIGRELLTLSGHSGSIWTVAFSPDGQRIAAGSDDRSAMVWEAARAEQVAAWQEEESAAAQFLAARQSERTAGLESQRLAYAADEGAIKRWLVLAPIGFGGQSIAEAIDTEQIKGEGRVRPKAGEGTGTTGGELKWQEVAQETYVMDFNAITEQAYSAQCLAYAACYIRSEIEQRGLRMLVGSDDESKVYLNGKLIHKYSVGRGFVADQDTVPGITLNAGLNVLVFKVMNEFDAWKGSIRFTDAQGNSVKSIQVSLNPDAKDSR